MPGGAGQAASRTDVAQQKAGSVFFAAEKIRYLLFAATYRQLFLRCARQPMGRLVLHPNLMTLYLPILFGYEVV